MGIADWLRRRLGAEAESDRPEDADPSEGDADERPEDQPSDEDDDPTTYPLW